MGALISRAVEALRDTAPNSYFVGGCVRDWLLGRPLKDLDLAVPNGVEELGRRTADRLGGVFFWLRQEMNVARILVRGEEPLQIDIVPLAGTLEADLRRRDFTINAMGVSARTGLIPGATIIDPTGGREDLAARQLRLARPDALEQDPLRCLRAFRLRAALGLTFHPSLEPALEAAAPGLSRVSGERIRDELFVLLEGEQTVLVMAELLAHSLVGAWSPALAASAAGAWTVEAGGQAAAAVLPSGIAVVRELDQWLAGAAPDRAGPDLQSTLDAEVTPPRSRRALARLAALAVGASARVGEIPRCLCLSTEESRVVIRAVQGSVAIREAVPDQGRERLRFFRRWEPGAVEAVLLALAVERSAGESAETAHAGSISDRSSAQASEEALIGLLCDLLERRLRPVPPLLAGEEVMAILHLRPGPEVGRFLQEVEERRADGRLRTAEEAREWLRERRHA